MSKAISHWFPSFYSFTLSLHHLYLMTLPLYSQSTVQKTKLHTVFNRIKPIMIPDYFKD